MPQEGSVAPRERVNIVYRPATGDAQEDVELPLKMVVMGDFTLRPDDTPLEDRKKINVDKDNFSDVLRAQNLSLSINVPNKLTEEEGQELSVNLKFESLKDFEPESIAKQIPELNKLLQLRNELTFLKGPLGNIPSFTKKLQQILNDDAAREKLMKELGIESKEEGTSKEDSG
jgi:type VI secretion system protein ImpB